MSSEGIAGRWICEAPSGLESLRWETHPVPEPKAGEVLVRIEAASINFPDVLVLQGRYQWQPPPPFVPGVEFAGTVLRSGPGERRFAPGDAVMTVGTTGGFATHACVPQSALKRVPQGMGYTDAAVLLVAYGTAAHALLDRGTLAGGESVLVLGAAGGTGSAAIQVAKAAGARVIAAVSTADKAALCRSIGADHTIDTSVTELRAALRDLAPHGIDVVYDTVGGALSEPAFRSIAWRGRYLVVGFAAGDIPRLPLNLPLLKGAALIGVFWGAFDMREPVASQDLVERLGRGFADGSLKPVIDRVLPMAELPQGLARLTSRAARGKVVLRNS